MDSAYRELWREYQNQEAIDIKDLTMAQLQERIEKWEAIEFEARSKRQRCIAEKRTREQEAQKMSRDALITNPRYSPPDSKKPDYKPKVRAAKRSKEDKLSDNLAELNLDLGELMTEMASKKKAGLAMNNSIDKDKE